MAENNPMFKKSYLNYLNKLKDVDLDEIAPRIGLKHGHDLSASKMLPASKAGV
ncbi:MAG: hypothetical protein L3J69_01175 [Desulfobacula sp.]|nr:hypothetical protein [Desulfobacula sp.]